MSSVGVYEQQKYLLKILYGLHSHLKKIGMVGGVKNARIVFRRYKVQEGYDKYTIVRIAYLVNMIILEKVQQLKIQL